MPHKDKLVSLFHINACSLNKAFDDLTHPLSCTKKSWPSSNKGNKYHKNSIFIK